MIIVRIKGGLGNQLFQYAAGYALAKRLDQKLVIDNTFFPEQSLRSYKLSKLNIAYNQVLDDKETPILVRIFKNRYINRVIRKLNYRVVKVKENYKYCVETRSRVNEWFFEENSANIFIEGYFQSENYFANCRRDLLQQFTQSYEISNEYNAELSNIKSCNSVAVHVRRGDFLKAQHNSNPHHYLLGEKYYKNALEYMEEHIENPVFFWFSDDISWVKEHFGERNDFRFISLRNENGDIDEMMLMKNCQNIIAANSTFSWWASWLNENPNAIHTCPEKRYGNEKMIPDGWIKLPVE